MQARRPLVLAACKSNACGLLADEQMARAMENQLVGTNRILALVTASQIASASAISFFCRLT
jgi:hypothetical protein